MVEIKVYETAEEAKQQLEKYERDNREAHEGLVKRQGESLSERMKKQTYFFVAELAAYVDEGPENFYFESVAFPFLETDCYDDIQSLVHGVKEAVRNQTPKNIETVLYTVKNHDEENQLIKVKVGGITKSIKNLSPDELDKEDKEKLYEFLDEVGKEDLDGLLQECYKIQERHKTRGLTEQEMEEFVKLYPVK